MTLYILLRQKCLMIFVHKYTFDNPFFTSSISNAVKASTAYGMEISAEKTKVMTNNTSGINTEIKVSGQKLETVTCFKYLGSVISDEGSKSKILSRIAQTTAALTRLKPVWNDRSISFIPRYD